MTELIEEEKYFVIVPTHNRKKILCETLASVYKKLEQFNAEIIVVDAGSCDGTHSAIQETFPAVTVIRGDSSMWWTATINHGLDYVGKSAKLGDKVILMNDDIALADSAMSSLINASELYPTSIIGASNLVWRSEENAKVYFCGGQYDLMFARHKSNLAAGSEWRSNSTRFLETDYLYGRLLIVPWQVFNGGNRLDAVSFPQYCADEDFTYSAKLRGFDVKVDTQTIVYVNENTTAQFTLCLKKTGLKGVFRALTAFNSSYNIRQTWRFSRKYAKLPILYTICRYLIILRNENLRRRKPHVGKGK